MHCGLSACGRVLDKVLCSGLKCVEVALDDIPDEGKVDSEILMRQDIAGTGDSGPGNLRSLARQGFGIKVSDNLPDDFEVADYSVLSLAVARNCSRPSAV